MFEILKVRKYRKLMAKAIARATNPEEKIRLGKEMIEFANKLLNEFELPTGFENSLREVACDGAMAVTNGQRELKKQQYKAS